DEPAQVRMARNQGQTGNPKTVAEQNDCRARLRQEFYVRAQRMEIVDQANCENDCGRPHDFESHRWKDKPKQVVASRDPCHQRDAPQSQENGNAANAWYRPGMDVPIRSREGVPPMGIGLVTNPSSKYGGSEQRNSEGPKHHNFGFASSSA